MASVTLPGSTIKSSAASESWSAAAADHSIQADYQAATPQSFTLVSSSEHAQSFLLEKYFLTHPPFFGGLVSESEREDAAGSGISVDAWNDTGELGQLDGQSLHRIQREPSFEIASYIIADGRVPCRPSHETSNVS